MDNRRSLEQLSLSNPSSSFSDSSKEENSFFGKITNDLQISREIKDQSECSVLVKSAQQDYDGILSCTVSSESSSNDTMVAPKNHDRLPSNVTTVLHSPRIEESFSAKPGKELYDNSMVLWGYCVYCGRDTLSDVSFQLKQMGMWNSLKFFVSAIGCCKEKGMLNSYQEAIHACRQCGEIKTRIKCI